MVEEYWYDGDLCGKEPTCRACGASIPKHWPKRKVDAIDAWNRRVPVSPPPQGLTEEIAREMSEDIRVDIFGDIYGHERWAELICQYQQQIADLQTQIKLLSERK